MSDGGNLAHLLNRTNDAAQRIQDEATEILEIYPYREGRSPSGARTPALVDTYR